MLRGWEAWVHRFGRHTRVGFARMRCEAMDMAARASVEGNFFFLIWSDTVQFSPKRSKTGPKSVQYGPKFLLKKNCIILDQNTPFCWLTLKENP